MKSEPYTILLADDSENDAFLLQRALGECDIVNPIQWVKDGTQAIAYLTGEGRYADRLTFPFPELINELVTNFDPRRMKQCVIGSERVKLVATCSPSWKAA